MNARETVLEIHISNSEPIELDDLAVSMRSLTSEFSRFCARNGMDRDASLRLKEVRQGSIVMDLVSQLAPTIPLVIDFNAVAEFAKNIGSLFRFLAKKGPMPKGVDAESLENFRGIVLPAVRDRKCVVALSLFGDVIVKDVVTFGTEEARLASKTAEAMEDSLRMPAERTVKKAVLFLSQLRNDGKSVGDRGEIPEICEFPKKIVSLDENFKKSILEAPENAFKFGYVVDVSVVTYGNRVVAYKVLKFHERFEP